jgi:hypothetical protein
MSAKTQAAPERHSHSYLVTELKLKIHQVVQRNR